jgi:hypothetical protein
MIAQSLRSLQSLGAAVLLAVTSLAAPTTTLAQDYSNVTWMDEPVTVPSTTYGTLQTQLWPALFNEPYTEGESRICLACEQAGRWRVLLRSANGTYREIGFYTEAVHSALPEEPFVQSGTATVNGYAMTGTTTDRTFVTAGTLWIPSSGQYTHVSGLFLGTEFQTFQPVAINGKFGFLSIAGTHPDAVSAEVEAFVRLSTIRTPDVLKATSLALRPPPDGGGQQPTPAPNWSGYNTCVAGAKTIKDEAVDAAWTALQHKLSEINLIKEGAFWGTVGTATGGFIGGVIGGCLGVAPAAPGIAIGSWIGGLVGAAAGSVGGVKYETQKAWNTYYEDIQDAMYTYNNAVEDCRVANNIPAQ